MFGLTVVAAVVLSFVAPASAAGPKLNGAGSSFMKLELDQWRAEVARSPYDLSINYAAQGSTTGRSFFRDGKVDFAGSDIPFTQSELNSPWSASDRKGNFVYVPVSAGGLGFMYNLVDQTGQQVTNLNLTRRAVCRIFTGGGDANESGMLWNAPEIQNANPTVNLPAEPIVPVVRADGSGTSYVFAEFCISVAPDIWATFVQVAPTKNGDVQFDTEFTAGRPTSSWPVFGNMRAGQSADGVAAIVAEPSTGAFSITYNEAGFAKVRGFPNASVEDGVPNNFVQPEEANVNRALAYATGQPDGTFKLAYSANDNTAYFPSTYSYIIAQTTGFPADKGEVLARFLCYAVTKGQRGDLVIPLEYARLSSQLVDIARGAIAQIPGAPPWDQCRITDAPPPPPPVTTAPGGATATTVSGGGPATTVAGGSPSTTRPGQSGGGGIVTTVAGAPRSGSSGPGTTTGSSGAAGSATTLAPGVVSPNNPSGTTVPAGGGPGAPVVGQPAASVPGAAPSAAQAGAPAPSPKSLLPSNQQIGWVLVEGAGACAVGVSAVGFRRRRQSL